jgi:hypothetical protein
VIGSRAPLVVVLLLLVAAASAAAWDEPESFRGVPWGTSSTTLIDAHLSAAHLRSEVAKTERIETTAPSAQASAHEVASAVQCLEGAA